MRAALYFAAVVMAGTGCLLAQAPDRGVRVAEPILVQRKVALVIGNQKYAQSPLRNPNNDASAIAQALRDLKFDAVTEKHDLTNRQLRAEIDQFSTGLKQGDLALSYYAGHGIQANEQNYLIPIDFMGSEADLPYDAYPAGQVRDKLEQSGARLRILILDACRNNPFRGKRDGTKGLSAMGSSVEGTYIAYATADNGVADDNPSEQNGLFTKQLLSALRTPGLEMKEIFEKTKEDVYTASRKAQRPFTYDGVVGRFYFNLSMDAGGSNAGPSVTASLEDSFNKGLAELKEKKYTAAIVDLLRASRLDPKQHVVWAQLADAYQGAGEKASAEAAYRRAITLKPEEPSYHNNLALVLASEERITDAQAEIQSAIRMDPKNGGSYHFNLGAVFANLGMLEESGAELRQSVAADPKFAAAQYYYGLYLISRTKLDPITKRVEVEPGTKQAFERYLALNPDENTAAIARGMLSALETPVVMSWTRPGYSPPVSAKSGPVDLLTPIGNHMTTPEYSALARAARIQGTVALSVLIGVDGSIAKIEVISGHFLLVKACIDAVKESTFAPSVVDGQRTEAITELRLNFNLDN
jgi:Tfp pilus assembly protein PilF